MTKMNNQHNKTKLFKKLLCIGLFTTLLCSNRAHTKTWFSWTEQTDKKLDQIFKTAFLAEALTLPAEIATILQMGSQNPNRIKYTAFFNVLTTFTKIIVSIKQDCWRINPATPIVDGYWCIEEIKKIVDAKKIALYNEKKKRNLSKNKRNQIRALIFTKGIKLFALGLASLMTHENKKENSRDRIWDIHKYAIPIISGLHIYLNTLIGGLSEFARKRYRLKAELGDYEYFYEKEQLTAQSKELAQAEQKEKEEKAAQSRRQARPGMCRR